MRPELDDEDAGLSLFDVSEVDPEPKGGRGRHELALEVAVAAAEKAEKLKAEHAGMVTNARAGARALDVAERMGAKGVYAVSQLMRPFQDTLQALGLPEAPTSDPDQPPAGGGLGVPSDWLRGEFGTPGQ